jgi:ATP-dependent DNA ligase
MSRILSAGFVWPCLPTRTGRPPSGDLWVHEIKHDGFRVIARKDGDRVRLYSRPGDDLTNRFPLVADAEARLRSQSLHRGEAVCCDEAHLALGAMTMPLQPARPVSISAGAPPSVGASAGQPPR